MSKGKSSYKSKQNISISKAQLERMNLRAAGIDIGSREHYVAVPAEEGLKNVETFGCTTPELKRMAQWLKECEVETIVMESTGTFWIPVYEVLVQQGFEVKLVDARHAKNVPGRKTDVLDCQWLQELHSYGLLRGCFIPTDQAVVLRSYWRQRESLVQAGATQIHMMQKALEQMNVQLHKVLSDITGVSGMQIMQAIVAGNHDPSSLAELAHQRVKESREGIISALIGNYREEHLFSLKQALELFEIYKGKIAECDAKIEEHLNRFETKNKIEGDPNPNTKKLYRRKNQLHFDVRQELKRVTGVDLTAIEGIDSLTALTIVSEIGTDITAFPTEKHFASWLTVCPNRRVTGGRAKSSRSRRSANRVARALRVSAQSLHNNKGYLGAYYRRMRQRLGAPKAITATAHKLARIIYRMLRYGEQYVAHSAECYEEQYRKRTLTNLLRQAKRFGLELVPAQANA